MTDSDHGLFEAEEDEDAPLTEIGRQLFRGKTYAIVQDDEDDDSVMIFRVVRRFGEETYRAVEDPAVAEEIFYLFQAEADDYEIGPAE